MLRRRSRSEEALALQLAQRTEAEAAGKPELSVLSELEASCRRAGSLPKALH